MRNEILRMLENNSRIDLHDLAIMLGTDESMVLEEIEKMENEGIICGYPTLINWDKTDTEKVTAFIEVRVTPQRGQGFEKLAERITNYLQKLMDDKDFNIAESLCMLCKNKEDQMRVRDAGILSNVKELS